MHKLARAGNIFVGKCLNLTHRQVSPFRFSDLPCVRFMSRFPILRKILLDILYQDLRESGKSSEGGRKKQPSGRRRVDHRAVSRGPPLLRPNLLPPASQPPSSCVPTSILPIHNFHPPDCNLQTQLASLQTQLASIQTQPASVQTQLVSEL